MAIGRFKRKVWSAEPADGPTNLTQPGVGQTNQPNRPMVDLGELTDREKEAAIETHVKDKTWWRRVSNRLTMGQSQF
jgi:hypothetical protein